MQTLEELRVAIHSTEELQSVVRTMKALAMAGIRQFQIANDCLGDCSGSIELALQAVLRIQRFRAEPFFLSSLAPAREREADVGVIVYGSSHGLCGAFNQRIADYTAQELGRRRIPLKRCRMAVVGERLGRLLQEAKLHAEREFPLPTSLAAAPNLLRNLLLLIESWRFAAPIPVEKILLLHHRSLTTTSHRPTAQQLLPLDPVWLRKLQQSPWTSCSEPMANLPLAPLFATIVQEHLYLSLHRATVESLTSENGARLAAMQAAEQHIDDRLAELRAQHRQQRQNAITGELLDIVSGFEALRKEG